MTDRRFERDNAVFAGPRVDRASSEVLAVVDAMPRALRRALHETNLDWDPIGLMRVYGDLLKKGIPGGLVGQKLAEWQLKTDAAEAAQFARDNWPARFGAYPALAAGATVMRYEERALRRRRRA